MKCRKTFAPGCSKPLKRGEEQNREEGEMVQKSREEGEIRAKM